MLRFYGFDIELIVDDILARGDWPSVCSAHDAAGDNWLIVQVDDDPDRPTWMCAPTSGTAIQAISTGRASPSDVLQHSATGTVEVVTIEFGRAVADRCLPCALVPEYVRRR